MAVAELAFWVNGRAVAQGNLRRNRAGATYDSTKGLDSWRRSVHLSCRRAALAAGWPVVNGPVDLILCFELARPQSADRRWPSVRPDLDKLERAICDALTGAAYEDDAQVCAKLSTKTYAAPGAEAGVMITVQELL